MQKFTRNTTVNIGPDSAKFLHLMVYRSLTVRVHLARSHGILNIDILVPDWIASLSGDARTGGRPVRFVFGMLLQKEEP